MHREISTGSLGGPEIDRDPPPPTLCFNHCVHLCRNENRNDRASVFESDVLQCGAVLGPHVLLQHVDDCHAMGRLQQPIQHSEYFVFILFYFEYDIRLRRVHFGMFKTSVA